MPKKALFLIPLFLATATLACSSSDQAAVETIVAQTLTAEAALPLATPTATSAPSPTANTTAPDPLPAAYTGVNLSLDECFDFDSGQVLAASDGECDMWLKESILVQQMNKAQISGYTTFSAPTKADCQAATYDPNDLAIQTDLYMCMITGDGAVGFLVARGYLGSAPFSGFYFDYWIFD